MDVKVNKLHLYSIAIICLLFGVAITYGIITLLISINLFGMSHYLIDFINDILVHINHGKIDGLILLLISVLEFYILVINDKRFKEGYYNSVVQAINDYSRQGLWGVGIIGVIFILTFIPISLSYRLGLMTFFYLLLVLLLPWTITMNILKCVYRYKN